MDFAVFAYEGESVRALPEWDILGVLVEAIFGEDKRVREC